MATAEKTEQKPAIPPKLALKKAALCEKSGEFAEAAEYRLLAGQVEKAVELFLRASNPGRAADVTLEAGNPAEAARILTKGSCWERLAELYETQRIPPTEKSSLLLAAEHYAKAGLISKAAACARALGLFSLAARYHIDAGEHGPGAECLAEELESFIRRNPGERDEPNRYIINLAAQAGKEYRLSGSLEKAAHYFERAGLWGEAAASLEQSGETARAAEFYARDGMNREAATLFRKLGQDKRASQLLGQAALGSGDRTQAAELFQKAGDWAEAARCFEEIGEMTKAATYYEKAGNYQKAAECHLEAGQWLPAAQCFEQSGELAKAAGLYEKLGDRKRQASLLSEAGEFFRAGHIYMSEGLQDEAVSCFQRVPLDDPHYRQACHLLGNDFREKGLGELAVEKLLESIAGEPVAHANLRKYYDLGLAYEAALQHEKALEAYQQIFRLDVKFMDVRDRLQEVKKRLSSRRPSSEATQREADYDPYERTAILDDTHRLHVQKGGRRYTPMEEIGRGGMGVVHRAKDNVLGRIVALKILPSDQIKNPDILKSFIREAQSAAALTHENIVHIYDAGVEEGTYFIAMEYVKGQTLKEIIRGQQNKPLTTKQILLVAGQLSRALDYAHSMKIIHRDIKSSNVMWTEDRRVKLMDFGLAKVVEGVRAETTLISGTPYYMSPEQTLGTDIDHRTDIYSLGVMLFELSTGQVPFKSGDIGFHHIHTAPADPREINVDLPEEMSRLILKCMSKKPEDRWQSALEVFEALRPISREILSDL